MASNTEVLSWLFHRGDSNFTSRTLPGLPWRLRLCSFPLTFPALKSHHGVMHRSGERACFCGRSRNFSKSVTLALLQRVERNVLPFIEQDFIVNFKVFSRIRSSFMILPTEFEVINRKFLVLLYFFIKFRVLSNCIHLMFWQDLF